MCGQSDFVGSVTYIHEEVVMKRIKYIGKCDRDKKNRFKTALLRQEGKRAVIKELIWGDQVIVLDESDQFAKVIAREAVGWVEKSFLVDTSDVLELYVIDIGQGDSVLMKTPDGKWHLIDAGTPSSQQMTKKGTANFLRWKLKKELFPKKEYYPNDLTDEILNEIRELMPDRLVLENVIVTHPDYDHYGGMVDVLTGTPCLGSPFPVAVNNLYHNGLGRFKKKPELGLSRNGKVAMFPYPQQGVNLDGTFYTELLDTKDDFAAHMPRFDTAFANFASNIQNKAKNVCRLAYNYAVGVSVPFLAGYEEGKNDVKIRVLAPICEGLDSGFGLRKFSGDYGKTTNGHSVVLRMDYGKASILLAGDLNAESQRLLLCYHLPGIFSVDVAKACHHGAEDIYPDFLRAIGARATIISSGDNEDYSHPRPVLMGASARSGRESFEAKDGEKSDLGGREEDIMPPLIYSTELARSVKLAQAQKVSLKDGQYPDVVKRVFAADGLKVKSTEEHAEYRDFSYTPISTELIYGLVNVRTDGRHILCGTLEEKTQDFDIKVFLAGMNVSG
jgi:beta-lactamase superfamily II metal-dependent hydrolase